MNMADWVAKLDGFLSLNDRGILRDAGKVSHALAAQRAEGEYEKYRRAQIAAADAVPSEFDKAVKGSPRARAKAQSAITCSLPDGALPQRAC